MTANDYLRKVGALPTFKKSDVLCGLALICADMFSPGQVVEPDCVPWTQQSPYADEDNFSLRCDFILYGTSGNVTDLLATARKAPAYLCEEAVEQLLKIRMFGWAQYEYFILNEEKGTAPWDCDFDSPEWNLKQFNSYAELEGDERVESWSRLLEIYKDGTMTDLGLKAVTTFISSPPQAYSYRPLPAKVKVS